MTNHDRHNVEALNDGGDFPASCDASSTDLGRVIDRMASLAEELKAPVVTEELRLSQYRRAAVFGAWLTETADSLEESLAAELRRRNGGAR